MESTVLVQVVGAETRVTADILSVAHMQLCKLSWLNADQIGCRHLESINWNKLQQTLTVRER